MPRVYARKRASGRATVTTTLRTDDRRGREGKKEQRVSFLLATPGTAIHFPSGGFSPTDSVLLFLARETAVAVFPSAV